MKENLSWRIYLPILAVVVISFSSTLALPVPDTFKGLSVVPGISALFMAIYQVLRDQISHEREKELQRNEHLFSLSVTSHMANVAFDKHVQFCEEYIAEMHKGLELLFRDGPTKEALLLQGKLLNIRSLFRLWLTEDIMPKLLPYEQALREIGASAQLEQHLPEGEKRSKVIDRMFQTFANVTGIKDKGNHVDEQIAHEKIINHLQQVLGIQELTKLRQKLITEAIDSIS